MRGNLSRGLRLELAAGFFVALAASTLAVVAPVFAASAEDSAMQPTQTTLSAQTQDKAGHTKATLQLSVAGEDGLPASGAVVVKDSGRQLAGTVLDAEGHASLAIDLAAGDHDLRAVYMGDATHHSSQSEASTVHANAGAVPDFSISVSPATLTLPVGQSGSVAALIKPENNASLSAPMFVTLSCQGLPDQATCTFTPENLEILSTSCPNPSASTCPIKSTMVVATQLGTGQSSNSAHQPGNPVNWALVLPGALGLMGLAWRPRKGLGGLSMLAVLGLVTMLGTTACNPRYNYFNHGPPHNPPTPSGTYKVTISAQSNNGITAITHTTTMVLTVQ